MAVLIEISLDPPVDKRKKQFHTRSRTGCVSCRQRHIRCDEKRPICVNCTSGSRSCSYPQVKVPLRDRRAPKRPGEQAPWSTQSISSSQSSQSSSVSTVTVVDPAWRKKMTSSSFKFAVGESLDPFDTLHFKMPFKSQELLHYFYHSGTAIGNKPGTQKYLTANMHNPYVFRNILLIAGLHYAWNVGDMSSFDATFLFHKVESIRTINTWIGNSISSNLTSCVRQIANLCVVESCLGDFRAAETHLDGLMLLFEAQGARETNQSTPEEDVDREFAERYLIMAFNLVHSLKSRLDDFIVSTPDPMASSRHLDHKDIFNLIHRWHEEEVTGLSARLRALSMFPSFFSPITPGVQIRQMDAQPILDTMRQITDAADLRYCELYHGTDCAVPYHLWASSGPSRLLYAVIDAHINSIAEPYSDNPSSGSSEFSQDLKSSWSGICLGVGLYLTSVLGVWNQGYPAENRLMHHILRMLRCDLEDDFADLIRNGTAAQDLWLWKAFLGAFSLAHVGSLGAVGKSYARLLDLVPTFNHYIRAWATITGIQLWEHARDRLHNIVFPIYFQRESLAKVLWNRALSTSTTSTPDYN